MYRRIRRIEHGNPESFEHDNALDDALGLSVKPSGRL